LALNPKGKLGNSPYYSRKEIEDDEEEGDQDCIMEERQAASNQEIVVY
jgi:hypothetical protein